jgi:hypothetical protein
MGQPASELSVNLQCAGSSKCPCTCDFQTDSKCGCRDMNKKVKVTAWRCAGRLAETTAGRRARWLAPHTHSLTIGLTAVPWLALDRCHYWCRSLYSAAPCTTCSPWSTTGPSPPTSPSLLFFHPGTSAL